MPKGNYPEFKKDGKTPHPAAGLSMNKYDAKGKERPGRKSRAKDPDRFKKIAEDRGADIDEIQKAKAEASKRLVDVGEEKRKELVAEGAEGANIIPKYQHDIEDGTGETLAERYAGGKDISKADSEVIERYREDVFGAKGLYGRYPDGAPPFNLADLTLEGGFKEVGSGKTDYAHMAKIADAENISVKQLKLYQYPYQGKGLGIMLRGMFHETGTEQIPSHSLETDGDVLIDMKCCNGFMDEKYYHRVRIEPYPTADKYAHKFDDKEGLDWRLLTPMSWWEWADQQNEKKGHLEGWITIPKEYFTWKQFKAMVVKQSDDPHYQYFPIPLHTKKGTEPRNNLIHIPKVVYGRGIDSTTAFSFASGKKFVFHDAPLGSHSNLPGSGLGSYAEQEQKFKKLLKGWYATTYRMDNPEAKEYHKASLSYTSDLVGADTAIFRKWYDVSKGKGRRRLGEYNVEHYMKATGRDLDEEDKTGEGVSVGYYAPSAKDISKRYNFGGTIGGVRRRDTGKDYGWSKETYENAKELAKKEFDKTMSRAGDYGDTWTPRIEYDRKIREIEAKYKKDTQFTLHTYGNPEREQENIMLSALARARLMDSRFRMVLPEIVIRGSHNDLEEAEEEAFELKQIEQQDFHSSQVKAGVVMTAEERREYVKGKGETIGETRFIHGVATRKQVQQVVEASQEFLTKDGKVRKRARKQKYIQPDEPVEGLDLEATDDRWKFQPSNLRKKYGDHTIAPDDMDLGSDIKISGFIGEAEKTQADAESFLADIGQNNLLSRLQETIDIPPSGVSFLPIDPVPPQTDADPHITLTINDITDANPPPSPEPLISEPPQAITAESWLEEQGYLRGYVLKPTSANRYTTMEEAKAECDRLIACGGITLEEIKGKKYYSIRKGRSVVATTPKVGRHTERSWIKPL